jgi:hypothetical protein
MKNNINIITILVLFLPFMLECCSGKNTNSGDDSLVEFVDKNSLVKDSIPILAYTGIPENVETMKRFQELKECGFTVNLSPVTDYLRVLDLAKRTGVKILLNCDKLNTNPEEVVPKVKDNPALFGYFVSDEPKYENFPELASQIQKIRSLDDKHICYINLFPYPNTGLGCTYEDYVKNIIEEVKMSFVSFDKYPISVENGINPAWYRNLEIIKDISQSEGKPFWAFVLSTSHYNPYEGSLPNGVHYPIPTLAHLRLQVYSNLSYGAQVIQYYTYWTPDAGQPWNYHDGPIDVDGKRSDVYSLVQKVNKEIQNRAFVFLNSKVLWVKHLGKTIPGGTKKLDNLPKAVKSINTFDGGAIVSLLEKGNMNYLVIVNRNIDKTIKLQIEFNKSFEWISPDGNIEFNKQSNKVMEAGSCEIYGWEKD